MKFMTKADAWFRVQHDCAIARMPFLGIKMTPLQAIAVLVFSALGATILALAELALSNAR